MKSYKLNQDKMFFGAILKISDKYKINIVLLRLIYFILTLIALITKTPIIIVLPFFIYGYLSITLKEKLKR